MSSKHQFFSAIFLFVFIPALFSQDIGPGPVGKKPNILWITTEDISPNLGSYGDPYARTPNLDKLAAGGVVYKNAFASAPVCAVARSSIIAGMYSSSMGSQHMRCKGEFPDEFATYPELLRAYGYYCSNNVKTDYNLDFDFKAIWDDCSNKAHWRNRTDPEQPFFAIFNYTSTHESRVNDENRYKESIAHVPEKLLRKPGEVPLPPYYPDTEATRELWARYYNIITGMDIKVGELLSELEKDGLRDETIIIFYSDHGAGIPRHKRWMFDSGIRVPMIAWVPEKYRSLLPHDTGSVTDELVSFIDLAPTALHLAGLPVPRNMHGRAFLGKDLGPERNYIYAGRDRMDERYDMQRAVRDKRFKYIRYYEPYKAFCQYMNTPEKGAIMQAIRQAEAEGTMPEAGLHIIAKDKPLEALYDTENDPDELMNLAGDSAYEKKLEELRKAHAEWSDKTYDTGLIPETIIRNWEKVHGLPIYNLMRSMDVSVEKIRNTALGDQGIDEFIMDLKHENDAVRYWAAIHLGNRGVSRQSFAAVEKALKDPIPLVRIACARALLRSEFNSSALDVLKKELKNDDEWNRLNAAQVLDESGEKARPVIAEMKATMNDPNKYVVRVLNHALNHLLDEQNVVR